MCHPTVEDELAPSTKLLSSTLTCAHSLLAPPLLAGNIEVNPGPVRYPCTVCSKAVQKNQRGICCDRCETWSHARCCQIDVGEYDRLGMSNEEWFCPSCIAAELPFVDESFLSTGRDYELDDNLILRGLSESSSAFGTAEAEETWNFANTTAIVHINVRSLLPKLDEIRSRMTCRAPPSIL